MPVLALLLYVVYLGLAFGLRTFLQMRSTGSTGFHGIGGSLGSAEWWAGVGFAASLVVGVAAPVFALIGVVEPIDVLNGLPVQVAGVVFALAGIAATFYAQIAMGTSWRIGVKPSERTALVTSGPFALVRNPIFGAMIPTGFGLAMIVPNWIALVGLIGLGVALELQVRVVEEPYLVKTHGDEYTVYAARVGRFLPGIGLRR